jgi:hypothetical protein
MVHGTCDVSLKAARISVAEYLAKETQSAALPYLADVPLGAQ